ncbi:DUF5717 family protein [Eubacterium oxidoreducens]|uniref:DUF5717 domain-containing protein n=1 Tax=Eubacterium oxidoreducens TaxID=1732 RepID=A0A1G6BFM6_EUBOX|nr:DUF5717 family protein [Eubacterium oxidoreducens]SDB19399.1 hypothetical protein SAMN02910417_01448 [Eubacterium oxidoreducens]
MRKAIQDLSLGKVSQEKAQVRFSHEEIRIEIEPDEEYQGSFQVHSVNQIAFRGGILSTNSNVICGKDKISGLSEEVPFVVRACPEGTKLSGDFVLVLNRGEYTIPFEVSVISQPLYCGGQKVESLSDLYNVYEEKPEEVISFFKSSFMDKLMMKEKSEMKLLFKGIRRVNMQPMDVEQFFVGAGLKEQVHITLEKEKEHIFRPAMNEQLFLNVKKSPIGYTMLEVFSDHDAVRFEKANYTSFDFVGNQLQIPFNIEETKLHAGNNFIGITVKGPFDCLKYCLEVSMNKKKMKPSFDVELLSQLDIKNMPGEYERKKLLRYLINTYVEYRLGRCPGADWLVHSREVLRRMHLNGEQAVLAKLYEMHMMILNRQKKSASIYLQQFYEELSLHDNRNRAYFHYLQTLLDPDKAFVRKQFDIVRNLYMQEKDPMIFWMISLMTKQYEGDADRLSDIDMFMREGHPVVVLYLEAYLLVKDQPYLLTKMGNFEVQLLCWMDKMQLLDERFAMELAKLSENVLRLDYRVLKLLKKAYFMTRADEVLQALVRYMVNNRIFTEEAYKWYLLSVKKQLKVNRLYEGLLYAIPDRTCEFPKEAVLYFERNHNLQVAYKAKFFALLLENKDRYANVYDSLQEEMVEFAAKNILEHAMDTNFVYLYEHILKDAQLKMDVAEELGTYLFRYKIKVKVPAIVRAYVISEPMESIKMYPVKDNETIVTIYPGIYKIILEDYLGRRFSLDSMIEIEPLVNRKAMMEVCENRKLNTLAMKLLHVGNVEEYEKYEEEYYQLCENEEIAHDFKKKLQATIVERLLQIKEYRVLHDCVIRAQFKQPDKSFASELMKVYLRGGFYTKAFELLRQYPGLTLHTEELERIIVALISEDNQAPELLMYAYELFKKGKNNEILLGYLCQHYNGALKDMLEIWHSAKEFSIDTFEFEGRLLIMMLFTDQYVEEFDTIVEEYYQSDGNSMLIMAAMNYVSHAYVTEKIEKVDKYKSQLQLMYMQNKSISMIARIALMKYIICNGCQDDVDEKCLEELLEDAIERNLYFPFYANLPHKLKENYLLEGISVIAFYGEHEDQVTAYLGKNNSLGSRKLQEMCDGIFCCPIILFEWESLPVTISYTRKRVMHMQETIVLHGHKEVNASLTRIGELERLYRFSKEDNELSFRNELEKFLYMDQTIKEQYTLMED